jgi:AcrR family transcriptional regulator
MSPRRLSNTEQRTGDAIIERMRKVKRPRRVLDRETEADLTVRQRELLDRLGVMFDDGFASLTMAEIAARLNCSLSTLYSLAPRRDDLVLTVVDRNLRLVGRSAIAAIRPGMTALEALTAYLEAVTFALLGWTEAFARDMAAMPAANKLRDEHDEYLFAVTRSLLDLAVELGEIGPIDTAAVGRVLSLLGRLFTQPNVIDTLETSPRQASSEVVGLISLGLRRHSRVDSLQ